MKLETKRLILREILPSDWEAILEYQRKPEYLKFYEWEERSPDDAKKFVQMLIDWQNEVPQQKFQFAIVEKKTSRFVGCCGIRIRNTKDANVDMGYEINPSFWGKGYATECAKEMLRFGFQKLCLFEISAYVITENIASIRVLEKIGMKMNRVLKNNMHFKGRYWDEYLYSVSYEDWFSMLRRA